MEVDPSLAGSDDQTHNVRPPWVIFHWGDLHTFKAVISVSVVAGWVALVACIAALSSGSPVGISALRAS